MRDKDFELIYRLYYDPLFLYAFSLTHSKEDAEDLVADAFVKALLSFGGGNLKAWLYTVLKHDFYNLYKKKKKIIDNMELHMEWMEDPADVLKDFIREEERRWLYTQIYQLPEREREIMLLSIQRELNDAAIADLMGLRIENVRVIRHRVKEKLIRLCKKEGMS